MIHIYYMNNHIYLYNYIFYILYKNNLLNTEETEGIWS